MKNTSMKLGITCLSHGTFHIPNIFSAPTISSRAKNRSAIIRGLQAAMNLRCPAILNMLSAIMPAIMLRKTAVSADIPYIHSYNVSILHLFRNFRYSGIFKGFYGLHLQKLLNCQLFKKFMNKSCLALMSLLITVILIVSTILFWQSKNVEFIYYNVLFFLILLFIFFTQRKLNLGVPVLIGLSLLVVMHLSGGLLNIEGLRLYDVSIGPLPFDKIHHFVLGLVFAFLTVSLFIDTLKWKVNKPRLFFFFVLLAALGFGALVEIFEFAGVVFLHSPNVGDYANNATDLVADLFGAAAGAIIMLMMNHGKNIR